MQQDIVDAETRCTALEQWMTTLQSESETLLTRDAAPAMDALLVLVNRIESLHQITQGQNTSALITYRDPTSAFGALQVRAPLVNACKSQSQVVFGHFRSLSEKARNLTQKFTEVCWTIPTICTSFNNTWPRLLPSRMNAARDGLYVSNHLGTRTHRETPEHGKSCRDIAKRC